MRPFHKEKKKKNRKTTGMNNEWTYNTSENDHRPELEPQLHRYDPGYVGIQW